VTRQLADRIE